MTVVLIGKTEPFGNPRKMPGKALDSRYQDRVVRDLTQDYDGTYTNQELIEFAGRLCYESWSLPNGLTASQRGYIRNIIAQGHYSVLEHISVSFYVEKVSRNLSHELIRHRHLSFSEISQRYVDMSEASFINPPAIRNAQADDPEDAEWRQVSQPLSEEWLDLYDTVVDGLKEEGVKGKKAREAGRYYLPSGTETKFVVTGNLRAWRDVLFKRWSSHADAEMQLFAEGVHGILMKHYPDVFADVEKN